MKVNMDTPVASQDVTFSLGSMGVLWLVGVKWCVIFGSFGYMQLSKSLGIFACFVALLVLWVILSQRSRGYVTKGEFCFATVVFSMSTTWCVSQLHVAMGGWVKSENVMTWWVACMMFMPLFDVPTYIWTKIMVAFGVVFFCDMMAEIGLADQFPAGASWLVFQLHHALRSSSEVEPGWPERVSPTLMYIVKMNNFFTPTILFICALAKVTSQRKEWQLKSDDVLNNLIPPEVADKLRRGIKGPKLTKRHTQVTCFFSDLVGYTKICDNQDPAHVMSVLDQMYTALDYIAEITGAYKVETIGDSYFAVSNLSGPPQSPEESAYRMAVFALAVKHFMGGRFGQMHNFRVRCGLHTGDLVAGVLGNQRPRYVLVGDTVNTASRMESAADPSTVNVSEKSAVYLEKYYSLKDRGESHVKGKGHLRMFELGESKEEYREGAFGLMLAPEEIAEMANDHLADNWFDENGDSSHLWSNSWRSSRRSSEPDCGKFKGM